MSVSPADYERIERQAACASPCTLNGEPAYIAGWRNDFARVTVIATGLSCDFAWETVTRILCNKEGRFEV